MLRVSWALVFGRLAAFSNYMIFNLPWVYWDIISSGAEEELQQ